MAQYLTLSLDNNPEIVACLVIGDVSESVFLSGHDDAKKAGVNSECSWKTATNDLRNSTRENKVE